MYETGQAWKELVVTFEILREGRTGADAAALLARVAQLQETRLGVPAAALSAWRQALAAEPTHKTALGEVERLAAALDRWTDLVDVYQELAFRRDGADLMGRADLLARAARLYAGRMGNRRAAIDAWKMVLNLDPENPATAKPAADALEALYAETGNVAALVKILRLQVGWADTLDARRVILFRIAEIEETALTDVEAAVVTLRSILEMDPASGEAMDQLERIFERAGQARPRIEILRRRIDLAQDVAVRQALWRQIAGLLERDLQDPEEAIAANLAILDESPEDLGALDTLARLYEQQGRHADRSEILERRLALSKREGATRQDLATRVDVLRKIAELSGGPLGHPADALGRWREILTIAPGDPGALAALERMLSASVGPALRLSAAEALETLYESAGRFAELAGVLQIYVESETDPRARLGSLVRLAFLQEVRLRYPEAAFRTYGRAIRDAISEPQLSTLLDAYERLAGTEQTAEVIALYREISPDVLDEAIKQRLDRAIAAGAERLGDRTLAAEYYRRILDRVPDDAASLAALEGIYAGADDAEALFDILSRQAELASDPAVERRVRLRLGALAEEKLDRPEEAISAYERVFELAREGSDAVEALDRLYTRRERWTELVQLIERVLERRMPEAAALGLRFRLAELAAQHLHDPERAITELRAVLRGDPDHAGAIAMLEGMLDDVGVRGIAAELLEPVYAGRQDWAALIRIGEIRLLQVDDSAQRLALTKRIARLYEEQLDDYDSALKWYGKVFQENPSERINLDQLLRLAGRLDRWEEVATLLSDTLAGALEDSPAVLDIVRRAAEIFDQKLDKRIEARQFYQRLKDARPDDPEVAALFEGALERWEEWLSLRELLDDQAGRATDADAKKALLRRSARIDEERLEDSERALQTLREIVDLDPDDRAPPTAADEIERLLRARSVGRSQRPPGGAAGARDGERGSRRLGVAPGRGARTKDREPRRRRRSLRGGSGTQSRAQGSHRGVGTPAVVPRGARPRGRGLWSPSIDTPGIGRVWWRSWRPSWRAWRTAAIGCGCCARWPIYSSGWRGWTTPSTRARAPGWWTSPAPRRCPTWKRLALSAKLYGPLVQTLQKGPISRGSRPAVAIVGRLRARARGAAPRSRTGDRGLAPGARRAPRRHRSLSRSGTFARRGQSPG